jgi:hypothetical protein
MSTDTPRTDEALSLHYSEGDYFGEETTKAAYEFARGLERELNEARDIARKMQRAINTIHMQTDRLGVETFPWENDQGEARPPEQPERKDHE